MEFQIFFWNGIMSGWKKKIFVLENRYYYTKLTTNEKNEKEQKFPLYNTKIVNEGKEKEFIIKGLNFKHSIKTNSEKEKKFLIGKLVEKIKEENVNRAFSHEFNQYSDIIKKEAESNKGQFDNISTNLTYFINYFHEIGSKMDILERLIKETRMNNNSLINFCNCYRNIFYIIEQMKKHFNNIIEAIYDYRDAVDPEYKINNNITTIPSDSEETIKCDNTVEIVKRNFYEDTYNFPRRTKLAHELTVNNNMIPELIKAATTGKKTLPIYFNEPISLLQKDCEKFFYCSLLNKAAEEEKIERKFAYISAFIIGEVSFNSGRILKPFSPLIGETFEYIDNERNFKYFSEQVSRRPHISAFFAEGEKWKMYGDNRNTNSLQFLKGCVELEFGSKVHLDLLDTKELKWKNFVFNKPITQMKGIINKALHYDFTGEITIISPDFKEYSAKIVFLEENKTRPLGGFEGQILKGEEIIYLIGGNWKEQMYITNPKEENKEILIEIAQDEFLKNTKEKYVMPTYTCNFNVLNEPLRKVLPFCDSRYRPDQREYEEGNIERSQEIKTILEVKQVKRQEGFDKIGFEYKPHYFNNDYNEISGDFVYTYKGGYWEDRAKGDYSQLIDIFKITKEDEENAKEEKK